MIDSFGHEYVCLPSCFMPHLHAMFYWQQSLTDQKQCNFGSALTPSDNPKLADRTAWIWFHLHPGNKKDWNFVCQPITLFCRQIAVCQGSCTSSSTRHRSTANRAASFQVETKPQVVVTREQGKNGKLVKALVGCLSFRSSFVVCS